MSVLPSVQQQRGGFLARFGSRYSRPDHTLTPAQASRSVSFLSLLSHPKPAVSLSSPESEPGWSWCKSPPYCIPCRQAGVRWSWRLFSAPIGHVHWEAALNTQYFELPLYAESANMTASCTANWIRQVANSYILQLLLTVVYLHTDVLSLHHGCGKLSGACRCCGPLSFGRTQNNTLTELSYQMFVVER